MKISIVTPSYNQGRFIEDAIQSVLDQNYPDFEHIIIDGNSTDDTVERLKKYPHLKWISEPDEGQSDALNKGFKMATGDIIGWLNCDDFYLEETFHKVAKILSEEDVDGVYSDKKFCDVHKKIIRTYKTHAPRKFLSLFHTHVPSESFFFKRVIIDNNILVEKDLQICMDQEFVAHILYSGYRLKHVKYFFAVFRWHDCNKSLETKEVKKIRSMEGIQIFNKYNNWFKVDFHNRMNQSIYLFVYECLKVYRFAVKRLNAFMILIYSILYAIISDVDKHINVL